MSDAPRARDGMDVNKDHQWALILAAGEGSRIRALTPRPCGTPVPKQYCSLHGGQSLVEDAIRRAQSRVAADHVCAIVAQQHHRWWSAIDALTQLPARNLIVQPGNRGTAIGILYSLVHILSVDPDAEVLVLPSDHYVAEEEVLIVDRDTRLPDLDFSRDLLEGRESSLCVLPVARCGWSDLGTPHRVGETLRRLPGRPAPEPRLAGYVNLVDLAAQHARFERSMAASL